MLRVSRRAGFTLLQLLVVIAVLLILLGLLLPAIQQVRIAAARMNSSNNLKQMMVAAHGAHDTHGYLPPSVGKYGDNDGTFFFHLLPYIEQDAVYRNKTTTVPIRTFQAPADPTVDSKEAVTSYASNYSTFGDADRHLTLAKLTGMKGTAVTLGLVERYAVVGGKDKHLWGDTKAGATYLEGMKSSLEIGPPDAVKNTTAHSFYPGGVCLIALCDGSVHGLSPKVTPATFRWLCDPASQQAAPGEY